MWHYETLTKESAYVVCRRDGRVLCSISLLNWVVVFIVPETILHVHTALRSFLSALVAYGGGRSGARCPDLYIFGLGFNAGFPGQLLHNHGRQATVGQGQYRGDEHQDEVEPQLELLSIECHHVVFACGCLDDGTDHHQQPSKASSTHWNHAACHGRAQIASFGHEHADHSDDVEAEASAARADACLRLVGEVVSIHIEYELVLAVILTAPFHFCSIATESKCDLQSHPVKIFVHDPETQIGGD